MAVTLTYQNKLMVKMASQLLGEFMLLWAACVLNSSDKGSEINFTARYIPNSKSIGSFTKSRTGIKSGVKCRSSARQVQGFNLLL